MREDKNPVNPAKQAPTQTLDKSKNYSEGAALHGKDYLIALAPAAVALLIFALLFSRKYEGLRSNDQFDYSQIARNLYRGEGFTTKAIPPIELAIDPRIENHPGYWRAPLYPVMICVAYVALGVKEYAGVVISGFFLILLGPTIYFFGRRISGRAVGISAAAITIFLPQMWDYSLHGLTEMSFAFLLVLLFYSLYTRANPFLIGLIFGLCYLERYNALVYLPVILWFAVAVDNYRWRDAGLFVAGALVVSLPWLIRSTVLTGNPIFSLQQYTIPMFTRMYPGYYLYATFEPVGPLSMLRQHPGEILSKYVRGLNYLTGEIPFLSHPAVMFLFLLSALDFRLPRRERFLLYALLITMVIQMHLLAITVSPVEPLIRHFVPFLPIIAVFAGVALERILRLLPWPRARMMLMGAVVFAIGVTSAWRGWNVSYSHIQAVTQEEADYLKQKAGGAAVITDQAWELAWKADLVSIWAPIKYSDFDKHLANIDYAFFSGNLFTPDGSNAYKSEYIGNPEFNAEFVLEKKFNDGGMFFVRR